ncbi:MAG TPA: 3'-5' exonuclease, partial [Acidobacteriaceae bacterium]
GDVPLEHLQLTANFRSHHALVAAFNTHFERIRPHQINAQDSTLYTAACAEREIKADRFTDADSAHIGLHWHPEIIQNDDKQQAREDSTKARKREAEEIATLVETWRQRKLAADTPASIAVLVRVKSHLQQIALALREKQIPYRAVEIEALGEQQEVLDALSLLRALLHPADRVAWLAVLRAPWCGLTVLDLHTLTGSDDSACATLCISELITARAGLLPSPSLERVLRTHEILTSAAAQHGRLALSQWVEGVWRSLGGPLYLDAAQTANVQSFFALLDECEEQGDVLDANLLLERLQTLFAPDSQAEDITVDLMTIHKAKGLEWDVVFVPSLDRKSGINTPPLLEWLENPSTSPGESLALLAPIPSKSDQGPSLHSYVSGLRKQIQDMELRRVFYVAATRAREELHLFGQVTLSDKGLRPRASTLLNAAWPAAAQHFEAKQIAVPAKLFVMPTPPATNESDGVILQLAAAAAPVAKLRTVRRLPATADIAALNARLAPAPLHTAAAEPFSPERAYQRAEGSLSARALGTVVHAYLYRIAHEFANATIATPFDIDHWLPGITAMLRSFGLPPADVQRRATQALAALRSTLDDAQGQWVLAPHPQAASELAMSTWTADGALATYRMDRSFRAGTAPLAARQNFLWIVDYKISAEDESSPPAILAAESEKHRSQLEAYARVQQPALTEADGIRLAAFYPFRKTGEKLKVWEYPAK